MSDQKPFLNRPPRIQPQLPQREVEIPAPPNKEQQRGQDLIEILLPLVTILAYLLLALTGRGRSIVLIIPMGLTMLASIFVSLRRAGREGNDYEAQKLAYEARLVDLRQQMENDHQIQRDFYHYNYPNSRTIFQIASQEGMSRSGTRLWERKPTDPDFGLVRLGIGTRPSTTIYKLSGTHGGTDPLMDRAARLAEDSLYLNDVPITLRMRIPSASRDNDGKVPPDVKHSLGVYSISQRDSHADVYDYLRSLILHFTCFHSAVDTSLYIVGTETAKENWLWARNLPHTRASAKDTYLCFEGEKANRGNAYTERLPLFWKALQRDLQQRSQRLNDQDAGDVTLPFTWVIVDMLDMSADSTFQNIEMIEAVSMILNQGMQLGYAITFVTSNPDRIPTDTQAVIELETVDRRGNVNFRYAEVGVNTARYVGDEEGVSLLDAGAFAQNIDQYNVRVSAASALVSAVDLLEMNSVTNIDELKIIERWRTSRHPKQAQWPSVPIGVKGGSEVRNLTFSANADGVHGMIAGTTGSGKSELLLTLIVGLAIEYDPSIVNFVLVDFKGGAAFDEFRALPHCVDIVTNLEGNAVDRMFSAIKAELDRRGEMIARYEVKHIVDYKKRGYHLDPTKEPFPHLFIIVDEFAEMVAENPEYKAQLDSITRLGRAIGVSLVLATQRPAGMITDQMRANMKFKICLRVETPDDSRELLRRSDAAYLPPSLPGRAFVQIGNEIPELVQVARAGGPYRTSQVSSEERIIWVERSKKSKRQDEEQVLSRVIVERAAQEAKLWASEVVPQRKPWPDPLPRYLPLGAPLDSLEGVDTDYILPTDLRYLNGDNSTGYREYYLNREVARWQAVGETAAHWTPPDVTVVEKLINDHPEWAKSYPHLMDAWQATPDQNTILVESMTDDDDTLEVYLENRPLLLAHLFDREAGDLDTFVSDYPELTPWAYSRHEFTHHLRKNPLLIALLQANDIFVQGVVSEAADSDDSIFEQPEYLGAHHEENRRYFEVWRRTNPALGQYVLKRDALYSFLERNPVFLQMLDSHPGLTRKLMVDPTLLNELDPLTHNLMWEPLDWSDHPMEAVIGLIDHPRAAVQYVFKIDLKRQNVAIFGAGGWGKTTFMRTLVTSLAATHSPRDLNVYVLDFAGRRLDVLKELPHVGAVIGAEESERVNRLMRFLNKQLDARDRILTQANVDSLADYNRRAEEPIPAILVLIDNFAEIRTTYEHLEPTIISLLRAGPSKGIHFVVSGEMPGGTMSGKVFNLFSRRITLHLADRTEYGNIVGRGGVPVPEIWGRGLIAMDRSISQEPLEIQLAVPVSLKPHEIIYERKRAGADSSDETIEEAPEMRRVDFEATLKLLGQVMTTRLEQDFVKPMRDAWQRAEGVLPQTIDILPTNVQYDWLLKRFPDHVALDPNDRERRAIVGLEDENLSPLALSLYDYPHFIVLGPPISGKTAFLRTWILSLATRYTPSDVGIVMIDPQANLWDYRDGNFTLEDIPHVMAVVSETEELIALLTKLQFEFDYDYRPASPNDGESMAQAALAAYRQSQSEHDSDNDNSEAGDTQSSAEGEHVNGTGGESETITTLPYVKRPTEIFVFIDNADDMDDIVPPSRGGGGDIYDLMGRMARSYRRDNLHFILCGSEDVMRTKTSLQRQVAKARFGFALRTDRYVEQLGGKVPRSMRDVELPVGRGFLVRPGGILLTQLALVPPEGADTKQQASVLDDYVREAQRRGKPYTWYFDLVPEHLRFLDEDQAAQVGSMDLNKHRTSQKNTLATNFTYTPSETSVIDYEDNKKANAENSLHAILTGDVLHKLTPDLIRAVFKIESDDEAHLQERLDGMTPEAFIQRPAGTLQGYIDGGSIRLPDPPLDDALHEQIQRRVQIFDLLKPDNLTHLTPTQMKLLGIKFDGVTPEEIANAKSATIRDAIQSGAIELPDDVPADVLEPIDQHLRIRQTLTATTLPKLTPEQFEALGIQGITRSELHTLDTETIEERLKLGAIQLPEFIEDTLFEEVANRINTLNKLPARIYVRLSSSLLAKYGVSITDETLVKLRQMPQTAVQQQMDRGDLPLPTTFTQEMVREFIHRAGLFSRYEKGDTLLDLLPEQIKQLVANAEQIDIDALRQLPPDAVQQQIVTNQIQLPDAIDDTLNQTLKDRLEVVKALTPEALAKLPHDMLEHIGVSYRAGDVAALSNYESQPDHLATLIRSGDIVLPPRLEPETIRQIRRTLLASRTTQEMPSR